MRYAVLSKSAALYLECVHYRLNWAEKGVDRGKWGMAGMLSLVLYIYGISADVGSSF